MTLDGSLVLNIILALFVLYLKWPSEKAKMGVETAKLSNEMASQSMLRLEKERDEAEAEAKSLKELDKRQKTLIYALRTKIDALFIIIEMQLASVSLPLFIERDKFYSVDPIKFKGLADKMRSLCSKTNLSSLDIKSGKTKWDIIAEEYSQRLQHLENTDSLGNVEYCSQDCLSD